MLKLSSNTIDNDLIRLREAKARVSQLNNIQVKKLVLAVLDEAIKEVS